MVFGRSSVHLATDYLHKTPNRGRCRVRIYLPDEERDSPVVICSEIASNPGHSVTNAVERITAEVIEMHSLTTPLVWIENYPSETTDGAAETFDLVTFSTYEVRESRASYMDGRAVRIGEPSWKRLDRRAVEMLVGGEV